MDSDQQAHKNRPPAIRHMSDDTADVFIKLGIDPYDVDSLREMAADLYYLRRLRITHQTRVTMNWSTVISAIASAIVGALGVILSQFLSHRGS